MKKIITSFVLLVALFIGFNKVSAAVSLPTESVCNNTGAVGETKSCDLKFILTDSSKISKGFTKSIQLYDFRNILNDTITITPATGWKINGSTDPVNVSTGNGVTRVIIQVEYTGDSEITTAENIFATGTYSLKESNTTGCGFNYGFVAACYSETTDSGINYYDNTGNKTTKEIWTEQCTCQVLRRQLIDYSWESYVVGKDGKEISVGTLEENIVEMNKQCYSCTVADKDGNYYYEGKKLTDEEFKKYCETTCRIITNEDGSKTYYNDENKEVTKEEYEKVCGCRIVDGKDGSKTYIGPDNTVITKEEYENKCQPNTKTGAGNPYIFIAIGTIAAAASFVIIKRSNKLKNV